MSLSGIYHTLPPSDIKEEPLWGTEGCVWKGCQALEEKGEEAESIEAHKQSRPGRVWASPVAAKAVFTGQKGPGPDPLPHFSAQAWARTAWEGVVWGPVLQVLTGGTI